MENLPKTLKYEGKSDQWMGFKLKFMRYLQLRNWTPKECRDYLCLSLEGKASEYYATLMVRDPNIGFLEIMNKLEKRFGSVPMPETAQEQLNNLRQKQDEMLEEWADRVLALAVRAFPDLPEEFVYKQAIKRICHGCLDREAGQHVVNQNLQTVEQVIDRIKSFQFNHKSIFAQKKEVREVFVSSSESDSDSEQFSKVSQTRRARDRDKYNGQGKAKGHDPNSQINDLKQEMAEMRDSMKALLRGLEGLQSWPAVTTSKSPVRSRSQSPNNGRCFTCQGYGHFARECPQNDAGNKPAKRVHFPSENLKRPGIRSEGLSLIQGDDGLQSTEQPLIIRQLKSTSHIKIPVTVQGKAVNGIVDTASEVTILSDKFYDSLPTKPDVIKEITLYTAGRDLSMKGFLLEPTTIEKDGLVFKENLYVAPLGDAMLIGLDFMSKHQVMVDMKSSQLCLLDHKVQFIDKEGNSVQVVTKTWVRITKRIDISPQSVVRVPCHAEKLSENQSYLIESDIATVLVPRTYVVGSC